MVSIQKKCYQCNEAIILSKKGDKWLRFDLNSHLHTCKPRSVQINTAKAEVNNVNEQEFVQKTIAKYEQNRLTEAERRDEMVRMHNENVSAWNAQTAATLELAKAMINLGHEIGTIRAKIIEDAAKASMGSRYGVGAKNNA